MPSKIARTGKVETSKWGAICTCWKEPFIIFDCFSATRNKARERAKKWHSAKVVRLSGTVTYTLAK